MPRPTIGSRIRKTRKQGGKSAPPLKASMKRTAKRGRQAPGTPRTPRRAAPLSKAAQKSATDTKKRMGEMGDVRAKQTAAPKKAAPKKAAPKKAAPKKSTATTAQDFADVGYEGLAPDPFTGSIYEQQAQPDPYAAQASLGLNIPEIPTAPNPGVSGPPASFGQLPAAPVNPLTQYPASPPTPGYDPFLDEGPPPAAIPGRDFGGGQVLGTGDPITDTYLRGEMPPTPGVDTPLPEGDPTTLAYLRGEMPPTPGIDTPLPGAAPGQMTPDPGYLPPPDMDMSEEEMDALVTEVEAQKAAEAQQERQSTILNLRDYLKQAGLRRVLPGLRGMGLAE